jgi:hypothetical protein
MKEVATLTYALFSFLSLICIFLLPAIAYSYPETFSRYFELSRMKKKFGQALLVVTFFGLPPVKNVYYARSSFWLD